MASHASDQEGFFMPSNWLTIDTNFPTFTGEESAEQQIRELHNYMFQLREGLQYTLQNLTAENFNAAALRDLTDGQKNELTEQLQQVYGLLSKLSSEVDSLNGRISGTEDLAGRVDSTEKKMESLEGRADQLADGLEDLEGAVAGEGGLTERVEAAEKEQRKVSDIVQIAEDGSVTLGAEDRELRLIGRVYINGVLYGQDEQGGIV